MFEGSVGDLQNTPGAPGITAPHRELSLSTRRRDSEGAGRRLTTTAALFLVLIARLRRIALVLEPRLPGFHRQPARDKQDALALRAVEDRVGDECDRLHGRVHREVVVARLTG